MAAPPANQTPTISPAEMQILVSRAGLVLNPGQVADLVLAWRQVAGLIAGLPHDRPLVDDLAYSFRLSPPAATAAVPKPTAPKPQPARAKPRATPKAAAKVRAKAPARSKPAAAAKSRTKLARKAPPPRSVPRKR